MSWPVYFMQILPVVIDVSGAVARVEMSFMSGDPAHGLLDFGLGALAFCTHYSI